MIGHYKLLEQLGTGGLGDVYRARDTNLGRTVAIKFPPPELTADVERRAELLRQASNVARLSHPSIATLFDVGEEGERLYLVFEYVPGELLSSVSGGHPLNPRRAIEFCIQLADALADAHGENLTHGDIRPQSIVITAKDRAKLLDFGMAAFTRGGAARAGRATDEGSDIFDLGCVLFQMLTAREPFRAGSDQPAPRLSTVNAAVPAELDAIVARALAPDPGARYQSAATLSAELRGVAAILNIRTAAQEAASIDGASWSIGRSVVWLFLLLVLGGVVAGVWNWQSQGRMLWRRWLGAAPAPTVIVMPFAVEGTMAAMTADAMVEDLMNRLGTIAGVKVVGRSSLRSRRGADPSMTARAAGAAVVLHGTIGGSGDRIAIKSSLMETGTGSTMWAGTLSSTRSGMLASEATLTEEIAGALGLTAPSGAAKARAESRRVNAAAYDVYVRGRDAEARGELAGASDLYEHAVMLDGSFAEAHAALAAASYHELVRGLRLDDVRDERSWRRMRNAAENAVSADPDLPSAQLAAGLAATTLAGALPAFQRAIELDPSRGDLYGELAREVGELDPPLAERLYRTALELDSHLIDSAAGLADLLMAGDRFPEADGQIAHIKRIEGAHSGSVTWIKARALRELMGDQPRAAISLLADAAIRTSDPAARLLYLRALIASGQMVEAVGEAKKLVGQFPSVCEVEALRVGLLRDTGSAAAAREAARNILSDAASPGAPPVRIRCAALAAASTGDANLAGWWLGRIAMAESDSRAWARPLAGVSGRTALVRGWYPWQKVGTGPPVMKGRNAIEGALVQLRTELARRLPTGQESPTGSR